MIEAVEIAHREVEQAQKALVRAVTLAYPVGTLVRVKLGGHEIQVEVRGHGQAWWHSPGEIHGVNTKTGKDRFFYDSNVTDILRVGPK